MVKLSKNEIKRIGERIRNDIATEEDYKKISELRSNYSPLIISLRDSLKNKESGMIISRRIKRMPSIIKKIKRFENMSLDRIQDLGGVRVILKNLNEVNTLAELLKNKTYKTKGKNNFLFIREKNYIAIPKTDGYRSIHQIYRYQGNKYPELQGLDIELQIRTLKQHQWATAVEILDMILNSSLKTGESEEEYKEFFKLCSYAIAYIENNYKCPEGYDGKYSIKEILNKINKLDKSYNIFDRLQGLSVVTSNVSIINDSDYLILLLDLKSRRVSVEKLSNRESAEILYAQYEENYRNESERDVVLVSTNSVSSLKKAYPNYFLDAEDFVKTIKELEKLIFK